MSVYKPKGSTFYHYDFQFKGDRYYGSACTEDREEAKALEAKLRTEARQRVLFGDPKKKKSMPIDDVFGRYWQEISAHLTLADADKRRLGRMAAILGAATSFEDLDDDRIALLVAELRGRNIGTKKNPRRPSNATVNRDIECLRRAWKRAAKVWKIAHGEEPLWGAHLLPEADQRVRELKRDEDERLFAHLRDDYHPIVRFAILGGMRVTNIRELTWDDVDFAQRTVKMMLKSRLEGGRHHVVPLTEEMVVLLANQRGKHDTFVFAYRCLRGRGDRKKETWVPFTKDGWRRAWKKALDAAKITDYRFHDNRHTGATRTLRGSGNLKAVQNMLGHSKITTTAKYAHALQDDVRAAMEAAQSRAIPEVAQSAEEYVEENQRAKA